MRVFVTGASGHVGSVVVPELLAAGHEVVGLARSDDSAAAITAAGAEVHRGSLADTEGLAAAAAAADGVIHLAFIHDWSDRAGAVAADQQAITAIGDALAGTGKPFVVTSGTAGVAPGRLLLESDGPGDVSGRGGSEVITVALAERGVRSTIVRLAPSTHGPLDLAGFVPTLIRAARESGRSVYVGDGSNRWSTVHELDAAAVYRLALEQGAAGATFHGVGEEGVPFLRIAEAIGRLVDVPVVSVTAEEASEQIGFIGMVMALDSPASSAWTRETLGWQPSHPGLIADLDGGAYTPVLAG